MVPRDDKSRIGRIDKIKSDIKIRPESKSRSRHPWHHAHGFIGDKGRLGNPGRVCSCAERRFRGRTMNAPIHKNARRVTLPRD